MRRILLASVCVVGLAFAAPAAAASPPQPVSISADLFFATGTGTFTATGPICSSGTITNLGTLFVGFQSNRAAQIGARHLFTCADGSGSFVLQLTAHLDFSDGTTVFRWSVLSGTGDYAELRGTGSGTGSPLGDTAVRDTYTGAVHFD